MDGKTKMTQEEKDLVLKDIGARLYYGVKISVPVVEKNMIFTVVGISESWVIVKNDRGNIFNVNTALEFKPYYRPISSMTEEEQKEFVKFHCINICPIVITEKLTISNEAEMFDWLNKKMFDYRGLIPKDLAISTEEFNPYN